MKYRTVKLLGLAAMLAAATNVARADATLFQDNFEGTNLDKWIGKAGAPHHGIIVSDPLKPTNHVLTFTDVNFSGDMFSAAPINVSRPRSYVLKFDFLGLPNGTLENGGFVGIASAPTSDSQQFWMGGTFAGALTVPSPVATVLVADGQWHHYEIDFTSIVDVNDLAQTLLMLEDWYAYGNGAPGDAFFDNIKVIGVYDITPILAQVPCEGPTPGTKWKNHGAYVSTVEKVVLAYLTADIITPEEALQIMSLASKSNCGKK